MSLTGRSLPESLTFSRPLKRLKIESDSFSQFSEPRTPDKSTHSSNSDFTGTSVDSKDEEHIKKLLYQLLMNTLGSLEAEFQRITWQRSGYRVELSQT